MIKVAANRGGGVQNGLDLDDMKIECVGKIILSNFIFS